MLEAHQWERRGEKRFCKTHGVEFALTEACGTCADQRGEPAQLEQVAAQIKWPDGCPSFEEVWRELGKDVVELTGVRTALLGRKNAAVKGGLRAQKALVVDTHMVNSYCKVQDQLTKIRRTQLELAAKYEDNELTKLLLEEKRRTDARGASH